MRSKRPWYFQSGITVLYVVLGYAIGYWQFAGAEDAHQKLIQSALENQSLHTKIIQVERQLQIEQAAQTNLAQELNKVQDENIQIKQDLVFYKNMTNGKRLPK